MSIAEGSVLTHAIRIHPFAGPLGAEVSGLRRESVVPDTVKEALRVALSTHLVLVFRGQSMSPQALLAFAALFGEPVTHQFVQAVPPHGQVTEIRKEPDHLHNFGGAWHFDLSFMACPPSATVLMAKELPAHGGDTVWSNQYLAYAMLLARCRDGIDSLLAEHTSQLAFGHGAHALSAVHPLAPRHPHSGCRYLYANPVSIRRVLGVADEAGNTLLRHLYAHAIALEFQYRHRWELGDIVVWDNRATMHKAMNDYPGERRVMQRVAVTDRRHRIGLP
ncbi:TauD/TfdA dioxygenase family protein [Pigmentiphaga litoralis]|uniref:TauD/TfdA dioxygenase family protein n=1 Tax=Pigmentiphaga litoralis TaxID=516702 RepID=UPI003B439149